MIKYISNKGGGIAVDFETAILDGFAVDGGLYVPEKLPSISFEQLNTWKKLSYVNLAFEVLSLFIDRSIISEQDLKQLLRDAYCSFEKKETIPIHPLKSKKDVYIMELFYGPTISFKDVGLAFLVNLVNFFLKKRKEHRTIVVATTGDTGPATAHFVAGKSNLDAWILYPKDKITEEQERQMTTLPHANIHPVGVSNCPDGGDDLDLVIGKLYANQQFKEKVNLSSVNSINWGRVMMQTVHYFFGYLQVVDQIGETVHMAVPSGGFGNLCAGALARKMGLPISTLIIANNRNACLHRIFSEGLFSKQDLYESESSAIDILIPYNFWRYLYFCLDEKTSNIKTWIESFETKGFVKFDVKTFKSFSKGFLSYSVKNHETLTTIKALYNAESYLLDPHGAVAMTAIINLADQLGQGKTICLATAHPAKFPMSIRRALSNESLPTTAIHPSIERAKSLCEKVYLCEHSQLEKALTLAIEANWNLIMKID